MKFFNKLERKYGRYAISNLTRYIIICYVIGYLLALAAPWLLTILTLDPGKILHGQVWRLVTWVLIPPGGLSIFTIIMLFFYYSLGSALEKTWGDFRYNMYILTGLVATVIGSFILFFVSGAATTAVPTAHTILTCQSFWLLQPAIRICRYCSIL